MDTAEEKPVLDVAPEPVQTDSKEQPSEPKTFKEHYMAAKKAAENDTTPDKEEPAQEPEPAADEPQETASDDDALLSKEELKALSPKERANAEKWQAKLTRKAQEQAARQKEFEQWQPLIETLQTQPDLVLNELAQRLGFTVAKPEAPKQDTTPDGELPAELKFLQPIFEARDKALEARIRAELAPVQQNLDAIVSDAVAAETEATIKAFEADPKYKDWKKYEPRMMEIAQRFQPTPGQMNDREYLESLYTLATAGVAEAEKTKRVIQKMEKAAAASEPSGATISEERVVTARPNNWEKMTDRDRMRAAYQAAKRGEVWSD